MKLNLLIITLFIISSCKKNCTVEIVNLLNEKQEKSVDTITQDLGFEIYDYNGFKKFLSVNDGKVHVINFWATWCGPCVKELPYFEKLHEQYKNSNVDVILVSLDFPHLYESKLKPFIEDNKLKSKVIALDDADMNTWIPKIDEDWSGSIPATIIYKNSERKFFEQSFTYDELEQEVKQFLNK
ncbi:TlpA disulfide reductase family protein [uncultured Algibacter sp.]|uniref:TlpA family protein disulfide reductase n=1 Tax=uncultured Algibacter sp. TaxID=298659 RepID=UPI00321741C0